MFSAYGGIRWGSGRSRQFQYEHTQSRIGGTPWSHFQRYYENSPIFTTDKINTPLLILHNDNDGAVPWYQGIEWFTALRRLGKPAWLLNYRGEPHWPVKTANRADFQTRMAQFFDHYLMDKPMPKWMSDGVAFYLYSWARTQVQSKFSEKTVAMRQKFIIAIVRITKHQGHGMYLAEDVFDGSETIVSITGKMRMVAFPALQPGDECVVQYSPYDTSRGRVMTQASMKEHQGVFGGYLNVRNRYESEFGPYTDDYTLIKRATK